MDKTDTTERKQAAERPEQKPAAESCPYCGHPIGNEPCCPRCRAPRCASCSD